MQANPDKFQVLAVGKKTYEKHPTINIQNFELTCEDSVKLLGIEIDYQLNFDTHISTICRKASQQLNIIKRLGPYLNRLNKLTIFHIFILSNFELLPFGLAYDNLLKKAKVPSLQIRRMRTMALETFKIMNKLSPSCLHSLVHLRNSKYYFRYNNILDIPQVRTSRYGKTTFKFAAATLWNSLPDHFKTENSFSQFKSLMQSWNGTKCCCSACR